LITGHLGRLGKHSSVLLLGSLLSRGVGMFLIPVYTSVLLPAQLGYWEALLLTATLVSMMSAHGITSALIWTLKTGGALSKAEPSQEESERIISAAVGWAMASTLVICGTGMIFATQLAELATELPSQKLILVLLLGAQGLRTITYPAEGVLKLRFQSLPIVFMNFGEFFVQLIGTYLALKVWGMGLEGMAWAALAAAGLRLILAFIFLPELRTARFSPRIMKPLVRYGLPLLPAALSAVVLSLSDRRFLIGYGMTEENGLYAYGDKWARIVEFGLVVPLASMWPAVFYNMAKDPDAKAQFARVATLFCGVAGSLAFAITMMGPAITRLFDTSATHVFAGAAGPIGVLAAGYTVSGLNEVARVGFQIKGRTHGTALSMALAAVLNLALNAILIPRFGAMGAAWATLAAYFSAVAFSLYLSRNIYRQRWEYGRLLHVALVFVGGAWAVSLWGPPEHTAAGFWTRLAALVVAPILLLTTGFLTSSEWKELKLRLKDLLRRGMSRAE
jgi:O-antigen/teichoic acid export membrane protein